MRKCKYVRNDGSVAYVRHLDGLSEVVDIMRIPKKTIEILVLNLVV